MVVVDVFTNRIPIKPLVVPRTASIRIQATNEASLANGCAAGNTLEGKLPRLGAKSLSERRPSGVYQTGTRLLSSASYPNYGRAPPTPAGEISWELRYDSFVPWIHIFSESL
jgi:hypothetical protein